MRLARTSLVALCLLFGGRSSDAVSFGQLDTFQDGTTMGWRHGRETSPNPPTNVATGGPAGVNDAYVRNTSTSAGMAGSKMVMLNRTQWTGDYSAAGVDRITMHLANFGPGTLYMRVGLNRTYASTSPFMLPPDGVWRVVSFDLTSSALTDTIGSGVPLAQVLAGVYELRILSAVGGGFQGDPMTGSLGVDNILAHDIANFRLRITGIVRPSGSAPQISFTTVQGRMHRIERRDSFGDPNWTPLSNAANVVGTGGVMQVTDNDPTISPLRLYRVVLLPNE